MASEELKQKESATFTTYFLSKEDGRRGWMAFKTLALGVVCVSGGRGHSMLLTYNETEQTTSRRVWNRERKLTERYYWSGRGWHSRFLLRLCPLSHSTSTHTHKLLRKARRIATGQRSGLANNVWPVLWCAQAWSSQRLNGHKEAEKGSQIAPLHSSHHL